MNLNTELEYKQIIKQLESEIKKLKIELTESEEYYENALEMLAESLQEDLQYLQYMQDEINGY